MRKPNTKDLLPKSALHALHRKIKQRYNLRQNLYIICIHRFCILGCFFLCILKTRAASELMILATPSAFRPCPQKKYLDWCSNDHVTPSKCCYQNKVTSQTKYHKYNLWLVSSSCSFLLSRKLLSNMNLGHIKFHVGHGLRCPWSWPWCSCNKVP